MVANESRIVQSGVKQDGLTTEEINQLLGFFQRGKKIGQRKFDTAESG